MDLLIQLSSAGTNAGPFDIYYDSVATPNLLASGITRSQLLAGYTVTSVPDSAVLILLKDIGVCNITTSLNIPLTYTSWNSVGNALSVPNVWPAICTLTTSSVAILNAQTSTLAAYSFDNTNWSQLGNSLTISGMGRGGIATLNQSRVAFVAENTNELRAYDFNGTNWSQVGTGFSLSSSLNNPAITALNSTRVVIIDEGIGSLVAYDFNSNTGIWTQKGNAYLSVGGFASKVVALSTTRVVTFEGNSGLTRVFDFDGTNFTLLSSDYINANITAMCRLLGDTIAYINDGSDVLKVYKYITGSWQDQNVNFSLTGVYQPAITAITPKRVVLIDNGNDTLRTFDLSTNIVAVSPSITPSVTRTPSVTTTPNVSISITPSVTRTPSVTPSLGSSGFNPLLGTWEEHYTDMNAALPEGYYIWKPNTYGTKPLPVIIYFGGFGEQQGSGLSTMLNFGSLPALINNRKFTADAFPYEAIVVMAKIGGSVLFAYNYTGFNPLNRVIQYIKDTYGPTNTDYNKYYLTGYSFGAGVSLLWAGGYSTVLDQYNTFIPDLSSIAAMSMISMAAGGYNSFAGANFKNRGMPMWFLHGDNDTDYPQTLTVNVNGPSGTGWVASLNDPALGTPPTAISPATLMNIGAGGHNVWGAVYDWLYPAGNTWKNAGQDVYQWMLSKSL